MDVQTPLAECQQGLRPPGALGAGPELHVHQWGGWGTAAASAFSHILGRLGLILGLGMCASCGNRAFFFHPEDHLEGFSGSDRGRREGGVRLQRAASL